MAHLKGSYIQSRWLPASLVLGLFLVYAFLPTQNSTSDAYDYAASVRWQVDLWQPHHLLYNICGLGLYSLSQKMGLAVLPLPFLKAMNAVYAAACLLVLWRLLVLLRQPAQAQAALLLLAGASLGTLRYATENETYIFPILFSLTGSYYWLKNHLQGKDFDIVKSSFWAALACLFHQIHFFWWLGLLLSFLWSQTRKRQKALLFLLPALVVPLGYAAAMYLQDIPLGQIHKFVFLDFYKGEVETSITYRNFLLLGVSFIRTFLEIHGRQLYLVKESLLYILPALWTLILLMLFARRLISEKSQVAPRQARVLKTFAFIAVLQILFAWFAVGNAEFLVMLPFLLVIMAGCFRYSEPSILWLPAGAFLLWNLCFAVLPNFHYTYTNHACVRQVVLREPQATLLLQDKNAFDAYLFYHTGKYPTHAFETEAAPSVLTAALLEAERENRIVLTDFTPQKEVISRAWLFRKGTAAAFFKDYSFTPVTFCPTLFGNLGLSKVKPKAPVN